jgi:hypothetical protein
MKRSFQLVKALAVADSLAAKRLKGLASTVVDAHAASTISRKPSALGQKASKRKRLPVGKSAAKFNRSGQWSEVEELSAERVEEGKAASQSTVEKTRSNLSRVARSLSLDHV